MISQMKSVEVQLHRKYYVEQECEHATRTFDGHNGMKAICDSSRIQDERVCTCTCQGWDCPTVELCPILGEHILLLHSVLRFSSKVL